MVLEIEMSPVCLSLAAFTAHQKQALTPCKGTVCMYSAWLIRTTTVLTTRVVLTVQLSTETKPGFFAKESECEVYSSTVSVHKTLYSFKTCVAEFVSSICLTCT